MTMDDDKRNRREMEHRQAKADREQMMASLRPATLQDYDTWLKGYTMRGGAPTHFYDYDTPLGIGGWFVALSNFRMKPLYGANAVKVIVPKGITVTVPEKIGHNVLFRMDGFQSLWVAGTEFVPVYADTQLPGRQGAPSRERAAVTENESAEGADDALLQMLAGANFGPDASVNLPSGEELDASEAQAWTSVYADDSTSGQGDKSATPRRGWFKSRKRR